MYLISKEFYFSASHQLKGLEPGHPCSRVHGHNYTVKITLASDTLDSRGFVTDYGELKPIKEWIDNNWDHQHLNDLVNYNPTAENMARDLFLRFKVDFPTLNTVTIKETQKTEATFYDSH